MEPKLLLQIGEMMFALILTMRRMKKKMTRCKVSSRHIARNVLVAFCIYPHSFIILSPND
jgi:hypothetical protein